MADLKADAKLLKDAVREAGALARNYFETGFDSWHKGEDDPVSEADLAVDRLLHERLVGARPDYGWLSEETEDDLARMNRSRVWIVDPIDGTRAFVNHEPEFTVCAALVEDGLPVLGAVFNPMSEEFFFGQRGGGASLNGRAIKVADTPSLDGAHLLSSARMFKRLGWLDQHPNTTFKFVRSIAYRMVLVGCGRYDATMSLAPKSDWDIAGADLIVREAGGLCTDERGRAFTYNNKSSRHPSVIVAPPDVHGELMTLLAERKHH